MQFLKITEHESKDRAVLKAQMVWSLLTCAAIKEKKYTYQELGDMINHPLRFPRPIFSYIGSFCHVYHLPRLLVLCVRKDTGRPGGGFENPEEITREVYSFPWEKYPIPSILQFHNARKQDLD